MKSGKVMGKGALAFVLGTPLLACEARSAPPAETATSVAETTVNAASSGNTPGAIPGTTERGGIPPTLAPAARMEFHSREAEAMRFALISGDRTKALMEASSLSSDNWTPHLKPTWKEHMAPMYSAAREYAEATSLHAAAVAVGKLGLACASCHRTLGGPNPEMSAGLPPAPSMQAHAWSVERLWFGLMAPSDSAWDEAASHLAQSPIVASDVEQVDAEAKKLQSLAKTARTTKGDDRASRFSDIMNTCATCHRRIGREP